MAEQEQTPKRRHHFVPRSYLRAFSSDDRRIHLFNLPRLLQIPNVSLRDQCYRHRFYGPTDELEDLFAQIEASAAPVFMRLRDPTTRARLGRAANIALVNFVALQLQRTEAAVARARAFIGAMGTAAFDGPPPSGFDMDDDRAVALLVHSLPEVRYVLGDLGVLVIHAPVGARFFTSDHPVVKFNHYCAGTFEVGVLGADCRGLEVALPISPGAAIVLYDREVYRARGGGSGRAEVSAEDVLLLNRLQIFGAQENLYFSQWEDAEPIAALVACTSERQRIHIALAQEDGAENHVLIAASDVLPDLPMDLSCLPLRRGAARMPWAERIHKFRHRPSDRRVPVPPQLQNVVRFSVLEHRYFPLRPTPGGRRTPNTPAGGSE